MATSPFRKKAARRALNAEQSELNRADASLGVKSLVAHGLSALAISALGLGMIGAVNMTATAQASHTSETRVEGTGNPDTSRAEPAAEAEKQRQEQAATQAETEQAQQTEQGSLEAFDRSATEASRNAVRNELDRAMADKRASERSTELTQTNEEAFNESGKALQDARNNSLVDTQEAVKREQQRLEEEKKKAEAALQAQANDQAEGDTGAPMPPQNPAPAPNGPTAGKGAPPMKPGSYTVGARWGAVGSWSRYHTGQDLPAPVGTPLYAVADGVIIPSNGGGWAGTHVIIRHSDGTASLYAHMSGKNVQPGQTVKAGQNIGSVGMTGRTFGPHLHLEHYPNPSTTSDPYSTDDPYRWLMGMGVSL